MLSNKKGLGVTSKINYLMSAFILFAIVGCGSSDDISTLPPSPFFDAPNSYSYAEMNIGCVGGSIMAGGGCWPNWYGMPGYLGEILGPEIPIINNGVGGAQITADGLFQIPWQLASLINYKPEINLIFIVGGFNDIYFAEANDALTSELVNDVIESIYNLLDKEITGTGRSALVFTIPPIE